MKNAHIIMQTDIQPTLSSKRINVVKINTVCNLKGPERVGMRQTCDDNFRPAWDQVLYEDMKVQYSTTESTDSDFSSKIGIIFEAVQAPELYCTVARVYTMNEFRQSVSLKVVLFLRG